MKKPHVNYMDIGVRQWVKEKFPGGQVLPLVVSIHEAHRIGGRNLGRYFVWLPWRIYRNRKHVRMCVSD